MKEVPAHRVDGIENMKELGDFEWAGDSLLFVCLCGCGHTAGIVVSGPNAWGWNGDRDKPTCTPSILVKGDDPDKEYVADYVPCKGWHGHLVQGIFKTCE